MKKKTEYLYSNAISILTYQEVDECQHIGMGDSLKESDSVPHSLQSLRGID